MEMGEKRPRETAKREVRSKYYFDLNIPAFLNSAALNIYHFLYHQMWLNT
jgi:hypothetical protein